MSRRREDPVMRALKAWRDLSEADRRVFNATIQLTEMVMSSGGDTRAIRAPRKKPAAKEATAE